MKKATSALNMTNSSFVTFFETDEKVVGFSNRATGYPFLVNGQRIPTSEHLYQALKFSNHPDIQKKILKESSPVACKTIAEKHSEFVRTDWNDIQLEVMEFCLRTKLLWSWFAFGRLLASNSGKIIYGISANRNKYWGVVKHTAGFEGNNHLGKLLMKLRDDYSDGCNSNLMVVSPPEHLNLKLLGESIQVNDRSKYLSEKMRSVALSNSVKS